jgi:hypothetical protein
LEIIFLTLQYDDTGIGFELKKNQMEYQHYDGMGVPITWEILKQSRNPSDYYDYPYLYEGTTEEDYRFALTVEEGKCCVTYSEMSTFKDHTQDYPNKEMLTSEFRPDDMDDANNANLLSTPKRTPLFSSESSKIVRTEINRCKDNSLYLSPTTKILHDSLEKASIKSQRLYTTKSLRETRKNIVQLIDHILSHDLVWKDPLAARFVSEMGRERQDIKERFNIQILSLLGSRTGQNKELCFPSFNNKRKRLLMCPARCVSCRQREIQGLCRIVVFN